MMSVARSEQSVSSRCVSKDLGSHGGSKWASRPGCHEGNTSAKGIGCGGDRAPLRASVGLGDHGGTGGAVSSDQGPQQTQSGVKPSASNSQDMGKENHQEGQNSNDSGDVRKAYSLQYKSHKVLKIC
jgi:hypothetical protein